MKIEFEPAKREKVLRERGLDLADAAELLLGDCVVNLDGRFEYDEERWVSIGMLRGQVVVCVTSDGDADRVRVITMWKANRNEQERYFRHLEGC